MSPFTINVLMHFHCRAEPHPRHDLELVKSTIQEFIRDGLLEPTPNVDEWERYQTTARGKAFVEAICRTPLPVACFIDPRTKEVL